MQEISAIAELTLQAMNERAQALQGQALTSEVQRLRLRIKELEG